MTQTSLAGLLDQAYDLHSAIHRHLETLEGPGPQQSDEWLELTLAADGISITAKAISQMIKRQRAADQPVPYTVPDDLELPF